MQLPKLLIGFSILGMSIKNLLPVFIGLSGMFLCSCDKHKLLMAEREQVESEINRMQAETKLLDDKFLSLKVDASSARVILDRNNTELAHKNAALEQELSLLGKKCSDGEGVVKSLRPKLESYKSKFAR